MLDSVVKVLTNPAVQNVAQNTNKAVTIETGLKAVGRPAFTLADGNVDKETRKYSAAKEFLYQVLCLGIYMVVIPPIFKNGGFKIAQKFYRKHNVKHFPAFKNVHQYLNYHKLACLGKEERTGGKFLKDIETAKTELQQIKDDSVGGIKQWMKERKAKGKIKRLNKGEEKRIKMLNSLDKELKETPESKHTIYHNLVNNESPKKYLLAKGATERWSIIGSVFGLTILAPELSHLILHPIMKAVGLEKHGDKKHAETKQEQPAKIDKQA